MSNPQTHLGAVVAGALSGAGVTTEQAAGIIGRSPQTLARRLKRGNFKDTELAALATASDTRASRLYARAEQQGAS